MKRKEMPVAICGFVQHKTAGWQGVIYTNRCEEQCITNGVYVWTLTEKRRNAVRDITIEDVSLSSMVLTMEEMSETNPLFGLPKDLIQAMQAMVKERRGGGV